MNKVLLDTNILVYSIDEESLYFEKAQKLINDNNLNLFTTSKNISEFLVVVTRIPDNSISIKEALSVIRDFMDIVTILYPSPRSFIMLQNLLLNYKPKGMTIHDFEIISIALSNDIDVIATINEKDFKRIKEIDLYLF